MKVLIAIDSFKGSVPSIDGSKAIASGVQDVYPGAEIITLPLADGGEGTVQALVQAAGGKLSTVEVTGPSGERTLAEYGMLGNGKTAVIEVAAACGLPLVSPDKRNPMAATTFGVGELILDAISKGCRDFVIGLGGSATNDAGVGMLQALGFRFMDEHREEVRWGGQSLKAIRQIDVTRANAELEKCTFRVACDVNNPLYGLNGAAYVFGPQKGATIEMVKELDEGLRHFADIVHRELNVELNSHAGSGAAGGLGSAFVGFLNGKLESGIGLVLDVIGFEGQLKGADFVLTGEGKLDDQTAMGKVPLGVAQLAGKHSVPVIALAGGVPSEGSRLNDLGITSYFSITNEPMGLEQAMERKVALANLRTTANQLFRLIKAARGEQ